MGRTADQLAKLAEALGQDQAVMMYLSAEIGLRFGEAAGIAVDRVDLANGTVTVDRQMTRKGTLEEPKTAAGKRTGLHVDPRLRDELGALIERRGPVDGDALLFVTSPGPSSTTPTGGAA